MADQWVNEDPEMQADQVNIRNKLFHVLSGLPLTPRQQNCGSGVQTSYQRDRAVLYVTADRADMSIILTLWRRNYFFFNFSTPVYKMRIIQKPNKLAL